MVPKTRMAESTELEVYGTIRAQDLYLHITMFFSSFSEELEDMFEEKEGLGRVGRTPFSTMGLSEDYSNGIHVDERDHYCCFISWFQTRTSFSGKNVKAGGEFLIPEYGIYFSPRHGSTLALESRAIYHGTRKKIGFTQLGIVLLTKKEVVTGGIRRKREIEIL